MFDNGIWLSVGCGGVVATSPHRLLCAVFDQVVPPYQKYSYAIYARAAGLYLFWTANAEYEKTLKMKDSKLKGASAFLTDRS